MDQSTLRSLSKDYLVPLFSGGELLDQAESSTNRHQRVSFKNRCNIVFKVKDEDDYRLCLKRSQFFDTDEGGRLTEKRVTEAFVGVVQEIEEGLDKPYRGDLLASLQRRLVAKAIGGAAFEQAILAAIDQLTDWAARLYEGQPISVGLGFRPEDGGIDVDLGQISKQDFGSVLSNGFDTLLEFDRTGKFFGHKVLSPPTNCPIFAPLRYAALADWATGDKIALSLNRLGEILVFRDRKLVFARRSGGWHFLTHEPMLTQVAKPSSTAVRTAIYETCIDASFARTGACLGVVTSANRTKWKRIAVSPGDYLEEAASTKSKTISKAIAGAKFQDLDRRFRQELVAIDGATLIDHNGNVLAVGAILKLPGGSTGGGRRAAALELSGLGLGVKVSQDGSIVGFHDKAEEPAFKIM